MVLTSGECAVTSIGKHVHRCLRVEVGQSNLKESEIYFEDTKSSKKLLRRPPGFDCFHWSALSCRKSDGRSWAEPARAEPELS
jgi:hypothetical protein